MQLLWLLCSLLLLSYARAQTECDEIQISDLGGAIAGLFGVGQVTSPDVLVNSSRTVCLAVATARDKYRFASVIVTYECGGSAAQLCPPGPYPRTDQFEFECVDLNDGNGPFWSDSNVLDNDRNDPENSGITTLRRDCSFCISPADATALLPADIPVDTETHCAACHVDCLGGDVSLGQCSGILSSSCCNFYENDACVIQCSGVLEPDANFDCVEMCDPLTDPVNGQVTLTTRTAGSVATYNCEEGYDLVGSTTRTCQAGSGGLEWSDSEPTCQIVDCDSLQSPLNGEVALTVTTFGSTANYSCIGGYTLNGIPQRVCQADGQWNSSEPACNCPLNCQNGGTQNALCTECNCAPDYNGTTCGDCTIANCVGCTGVPAVCNACETGYALNSGVCECTLENCMTCQGVPPICVQCKDGYAINAEDNTLCECSLDNCLECDGSPPSCVRCSPGFTLIGGGCVFIERPCDVDFCQMCGLDDLSVCEQCETRYLNRQGACVIIEDNGLDIAQIIGIAIGCIIGAILLLTIAACIVASIYRHKHPLVVHKKKQRPRPQLLNFIDGFGNVIAHPLAVYRHATNALNEEDLLELDLEEGMEAEEVTEGEGEEWEDEEDEEGEEASDSDEGSLSNIDEESEHAEEDSM